LFEARTDEVGLLGGANQQGDLFLEPIDWITIRSVHRGFVDVSLGQEVFTDLDFADDVSITAEMLEVLILALEIMNEESSALGLEINWNKTKILFDANFKLVVSTSGSVGYDIKADTRRKLKLKISNA